MDEKDLKIESLKQRIATDASAAADREANYRVEITLLQQALNAANEKVKELEEELAPTAEVVEPDSV